MIATVLIALATGAVPACFVWLSTREKNKTDNATALATTAITRMTVAEGKIDQMEKEWSNLRRSIFPHQAWDVKAHRAALQSDPDFPAPPDLMV